MTAEHYVSPPLEVTVGRAYRDRVRHWVAHGYGLRLRRVVACIGVGEVAEKFGELVDDALDQGIITAQDMEEIWNSHTMVLRGQIPDSNSVAFAVVDVALTIDDSHIDRVAARAAILRRMVRESVIAAIVGAFIGNGSLKQSAGERGVILIPTSMEDAKLYRYFSDGVLEDLYGSRTKL